MSRSIWLSVALVLAVPLSGAALADGDGGAPPKAPDAPKELTKDEAAAKYLKETGSQLSKMADQDAKAAIKKLLELWKDKELGDDTKKPIPGLLEKFGRNDKTLVAIDAIDALGELGGPAGAPSVLGILEHSLKAKDPSVDIYGSCLRALEKLADTKASTLKTLQDLLKHSKDDVVGKAAHTLAGYKEAPGKVRRDLLEELIKSTEGTCAKARDAKNANDVRKWNIIQGGVMLAANALSGQKFKDVQEARTWFNEHKKDKSWDK